MTIDSNSACAARNRSAARRARARFVLAALALTGGAACGGKAQETIGSADAGAASSSNASLPLGDAGAPSPPSDASAPAVVIGFVAPDGGSCVDEDGGPRTSGIARVPLNHRPGSSSCPMDRAAANASVVSDEAIVASGSVACTADSQCTMGLDGRCGQMVLLYQGRVDPLTLCSYDQCFADSDCEGGLPCDCRASSVSSSPNVCATVAGDCSVDSDCGPGGYCSPSLAGCSAVVNECHTPCDRCIDDADCGDGGDGVGCNYDPDNGIWECFPGCDLYNEIAAHGVPHVASPIPPGDATVAR